MYAKLFASLYEGTLRGQSDEILVFTNLLAHSTKTGSVDTHFRCIAEETGLSVPEVRAAVATLESPDPESRSPEEEGRRIVRMDEHRDWGWRIVNHGKYRAIRSEEDRAEQNRLAQARWREKNKQNKPASATGNADKPIQRQSTEPELPPSGVQGGIFPKIEPTPPPKTETQLRLGALFGQRPTTPWDAKHVKALKAIGPIQEEDLKRLEWYYRLKLPTDNKAYRRKSLGTLLNNFSDECDRARMFREPSHY